MSLYDEGLELDRMYQNCRADVEALQERVQELEQLVSDYETLAEEAPHESLSYDAVRWNIRHMELQQRKNALLNEGKTDDHRTTGQ